MKKAAICGMLVLTLLVLVTVACAAPKPTSTPAPAPTAAPTTAAMPNPTPTVGPTPTPRPTVAPTVGPTASPAPTAAATPAKVYKFTFAHISAPPPAEVAPYLRLSLEELERRSGGRIKFDILWTGQHPIKNPDLLGAVRDRLVDSSYDSSEYFIGAEPIPGALGQPFLLTGGVDEYWWIWDKIRAEASLEPLARWKQMPLFEWTTTGIQAIEAARFARTKEEVRGLKIRAAGAPQATQLDAMGLNALTIDYAELVPSLQKGLVDGMVISIPTAYRGKMFEIVKYITRVPGWVFLPMFIGLNLDAFNELPPDLQQVCAISTPGLVITPRRL